MQSFDTTRVFSAWIYRIAHNEFINAIKKRGVEPLSFFDPDTLFPHPTTRETPESAMIQEETKQLIEKSLTKLRPKYREILVLYYLEELDYKTISDVLQIPVPTVGVRLKRAKDMLKELSNKP
jgi:RNA polymerase sigma-70 factor (ECF subfamily)